MPCLGATFGAVQNRQLPPVAETSHNPRMAATVAMNEREGRGDRRTNLDDFALVWREARKSGRLTDVNLLVGKGKPKHFSAHKNILALRSEYFKRKFYDERSEIPNLVEIPDVEPEEFEKVLEHTYGDELKVTAISIAAKIYLAAQKLIMSDLKDDIESSIFRLGIDDQQFWVLIRDDEILQIAIIKNKCLDYLCENAATLLKSYKFSDVSPYVLEQILKLDKIKISEFELLSAVARWGRSNAGCDVKAKLAPFLPYIRFSCLTSQEFSSFEDSYPDLIDSHDSCQILKHLSNRTVHRLPVWCSQVFDNRC